MKRRLPQQEQLTAVARRLGVAPRMLLAAAVWDFLNLTPDQRAHVLGEYYQEGVAERLARQAGPAGKGAVEHEVIEEFTRERIES